MANSNVTAPDAASRRLDVTHPLARVQKSGSHLESIQDSVRTQQKSEATLQVEDLTPEQLRSVATDLGKVMTSINRDIHYEIDDRTNLLITKIVDQDTKEVIRQIPPQEMLRISRQLSDFIGLLLDEAG